MKKGYILTSAMILSAALMSACGSSSTAESSSASESTAQSSVVESSSEEIIKQDGSKVTEQTQAAISIFEDFNTLEEAAKCAGFEITAPDTIEGYPSRYIQAVKNEMIQVIYDDSAAENSITIRKSNRIEDNMISGDYNEYSVEKEEDVEGVKVTLKGNEEENVNLATWINGDYTYSFGLTKAMPKAELIEIIKGIK